MKHTPAEMSSCTRGYSEKQGRHPSSLRISILMLVLILFPVPQALSQEQIYAANPVWRSLDWYQWNHVSGGYSAAFGDIDRDGRLDLIFASQSIINFLNEGGPSIYTNYESVLTFEGDPKLVVSADLNQDGFIDVAWAGSEWGSTPDEYLGIALNQGGVLDTAPWILWNQDRSRAIALGDVDGDDDLDVICGGGVFAWGGGRNRLYINDGSHEIVNLNPVWESSTESATYQVALGDLDGDGDLDLLCGNRESISGSGANTLFINRFSPGDTTVFLGEPDHQFLPSRSSMLALGDVDGDGDFDLVSARHDSCVVLLNRYDEGPAWQEAIFDGTPVWAFHPASAEISSAALGDVDGDGLLDLFLGTDEGDVTRLFLNTADSTIFATIPAWEFDDGENSLWLEPGDADNDGDLDLVTVNGGVDQGAFLYLNQSPVLEITAREPMITPESTWSVALGDINGDGHVDLICGNDGTTRLYLNTPSWSDIFLPVSQWSNQFPAATRDVAVADVTGDGALDLICGNFNEANTLFENTGDSFTPIPNWFSDPTEPTTSLAVGDVSGNGYPDVVCGNLAAANRMYRNVGGALEAFTNWTSGESNNTRSVALGDVDGDGDLDLVCGNDGQSNTLYLNEGGRLANLPAWRTRPGVHRNATWSVALGDVDGDGFLDLACGNNGQGNTLYLNSNGELPEDPAWTSLDADSTRSLELHDIDGDGDLDLVCGNYNAPNTVYLNIGGIFTGEPVWHSASSNLTSAVTAGDLDNDGDWDLVSGNDTQVNELYFGRRNPVFLGDPAAPTNHLPFSPTFLEDVTVLQPAANRYQVQVTAVDIESDPFWLLPRYRYRDESAWRPVGDGNPFGPFAATPTGSAVQFAWDVSTLAIDEREVVLGLYAINSPNSVGIIRQNTSFQKDIGPLNVNRPEVAVAPATLAFAGVTVGDTVSATLSVTNAGNEVLNVSSIALPSAEMWLAEAATFTVPAGETSERMVYLGPRSGLSVTGDVMVSSDAPLTPAVTISVQVAIIGLTVATRALIEGDTAPLGEALTIHVLPADEVHLERCALYYRAAGSNGNFTSTEMAPSGGFFIGLIPGQDVTESGLDYFIELENSGVFATDPVDTTGGNFFALPVTAPQGIVATTIPNAESGYLAGRSVRIEVSLPQGAVFTRGALHHRPGGSHSYSSLDLVWDGSGAVATVPAEDVGPRGLEYWIEVVTATDSLTAPASSPAEQPHSQMVLVQDLQEPATTPAEQYRLVSVPLRFGEEFTGTLEALLADQAEFGSYDPLRWRSFRWLPGDEQYVELSDPAHATEFRPEPGRGFWLICRQASRITTAPITGFSTPTDSAAVVVLAPGWNQIGHPFSFPVDWYEVLVDGQAPNPSQIEGPWFYDGTPYVAATVLEPFAGYWVLNKINPPRDLILTVPPRESTAGKREPVQGDLVSGAVVELEADIALQEDISWQLTLVASCAGVQDGSNRLGMASTASERWDRHDRREPPPAPERSLSLYFPHPDWEQAAGLYTVDMQQDSGDEAGGGHSWSFDVAKNFTATGVADEVRLEFPDVDGLVANLAPDQTAVLLDGELLTTVDLRSKDSYTFFLGRRDPIAAPSEARFLLLVGSEDYIAEQASELSDIPLQTALLPNRPNPFNPATVIRYEMAQAGQASLKIYDVTGALVKTLRSEHHAVGRHEVAWRGEDARGRQVAAGVYFFRLETAAGHRETRKMLLVK